MVTGEEKLVKKFEDQRLTNERKYHSINIKGNSIINKLNLSGFIDDTPIYNEIREKIIN